MNTEVVKCAANSDWLVGDPDDVIQEIRCIWLHSVHLLSNTEIKSSFPFEEEERIEMGIV